MARAVEPPSPVAGKRVALRGYDPVAYFTDGHPVEGRRNTGTSLTTRFICSPLPSTAPPSSPIRITSLRNIAASAPCRFRSAADDEGLPDVWEIYQGKLLVFGRPTGVQDFATDQQGFLARGQGNWAATHPHPDFIIRRVSGRSAGPPDPPAAETESPPPSGRNWDRAGAHWPPRGRRRRGVPTAHSRRPAAR